MNSGKSRSFVALVTGATGMIGQHTVRELQKYPDWFTEIRTVDRKPFEQFLDFEVKIPVKHYTGCCTDANILSAALKEVDVVFHCAGKMYTMDVYINVDHQEYWRDHYLATEVLISCMRKCGVEWLIFISDAGVCWDDISCVDVSESETSAPPANAYYLGGAFAKSKMMAELMVKAANNTNLSSGLQLKTLIIRPSLLYGEGDNFLVKHALKAAGQHGILWRLGKGTSRVQVTYAGNVGHMALISFQRLTENPIALSGQVFFCTEYSEAVHYFDFVEKFLKPIGYRTSPFYLPFAFIYGLTMITECLQLALYYTTGIKLGAGLPNLRMVRKSSHYTFTYDASKAQKLLGYKPIYSTESAVQSSIDWWTNNWVQKLKKD